MLQDISIKKLFDAFNNFKIVIVGDIMTDTYVHGHVDRISPEAPVPVIMVDKTENRLGGAANVALNIKAMGATPLLVSVIGNDDEGKALIALIKDQTIEHKYIAQSPDRITTRKTRVLAKNHQMLRLDKEVTHDITLVEQQNIINTVATVLKEEKPEVLIFQDYNKGILTEKVIREITMLCLNTHVAVAVDPKKNNFFAYQLCTLFKPNLREIKESLHTDFDEHDMNALNEVSSELHKQLHHAISMITLGAEGIYVRAGNDVIKKNAHVRTVADVSGAGDTVISIAALCLAAKTSLPMLTALCNIAGGLVCEYAGVVSIDKKQLLDEATLLIP